MSRLALAIGVVLCVAALGSGASEAQWSASTVVVPEQSLPITFSHQKHLAQGVQCQLCHGSVLDSLDARDHNIPGHLTCGICHRMDLPNAGEMFPKSACTTCHGGFEAGEAAQLSGPPLFAPLDGAPRPPRVVIPPALITFPHKTHIDAGVPCLDCHQGVDSADLATRDHLPTMATCLGCHDGMKAPAECTTCHLQGVGGRVLTDLGGAQPLMPSGRFRPDDHGDPRWLKVHQSAARVDEAGCESCHAKNFCLSCHDGTQKRVDLHPADWVMTHGLEAQRRSLDCYACHEPTVDCISCHTTAQVVPGRFPSPTAETDPGDRRFHPVGWAGAPGEIPGTEHHSHQARRALETCEACHTEDLCLTCHAAQVNPHPAAWAEAPDGFPFGQGEGTVCLKCHSPQDPTLSRLRP